jgi:serine/threonine-protein kinase
MISGSRIRDYEVWGPLGEGGMSQVWLAKHAVLAIPVVIKTLRTQRLDGSPPSGSGVAESFSREDAANRLLLEARMTARVSDPRVVRALDAGIHEGTPYLVQEYVDGIDLEELDRRRRDALGVGLPLWFICDVMKQTCRALHAAHQTGVIHRDVKPSNVFGSPETGIRLGDFGIAVAHSEGRPGDISGTVGFMAPEQLLGGELGRATDVYGAGATAFLLRYGHYAFANVDEIVDPTKLPLFPAPQHLAEGYFQQLVRTMLTKDPDARPHCMATCARHFGMIARSLRSATHGLASPVGKNGFRVGSCSLSLEVGDISTAAADAIVSSTNVGMHMRSGVGEALRLRGGDSIEDEILKSGNHALGACVATSAGKLSARHVLHAVSAWNEASCVGRATQRAFLLADEIGAKSLALPALGTGHARVSMEICAKAMMTALRWHISLGGTRLESVRVVLDSDKKLRAFREVAEDALRAEEEALSILDLGLAVGDSPVRGDSATHIDIMGTASHLVASLKR